MIFRAMTTLALLSALAPIHPARAGMACEALTQLSLPGASVTAARRVVAGAFVPAGKPGAEVPASVRTLYGGLPAFCQVALTATPARESEIRIEVWLPESGWNGNLQAVGDGGLAGSIPTALMAPALAAGYAAAGTDTGHVGANADFMPAQPAKLVDFGYRATHEMAKAAKAVIAAHFDKAPTYAYYNACSGGGRHGLTSAQRYPADFHGVVAGAPSWNQARLDAGRIGINLTINRTPEHRIPASKYPLIHAAVLDACDAQDGVKDGVIENPKACKFDYASLVCQGADGPSCLTPAQVESARTITSPFRDSASGKTLLEVHLRPGAELSWSTLGGPKPLPNSIARVRNFHLKDTAWEFRLDNIAATVERAVQMDAGLIASDNFDLKPFFDRGGKLILWHGWSDPQVPADNSILYYENVLRTVGSQATNSMALFMLPGVLHCRGGPGPDSFEQMGAISRWVESGEKPTRLVARRVANGKVERTRPLCPYPQVASYLGSGDTNEATNFVCAPK